MVKQTAIELLDISLGYPGKSGLLTVIEKTCLKFYSGELVGIVGVNGAGKSTLLKSLSASLLPLTGKILIEGKDLRHIPLSELAKKISIVLTEKIRGFNLTAFDLVAAGQMPYTNSFHQLEEKHLAVIEEAIRTTGIEAHQHKKLHELSDGLFQKAIIAKALAQQTHILLLDEPTAYLDYASKHNLFVLLKQLCDERSKCILVSSHDLDLLVKYCTKLLVISTRGTELLDVNDVKKNPAFLEIGGGYL